MEGGGAVIMTGDVPTRPFVRQQVHVQNAPASTGTEHGRLLFEPILLHYIESALVELGRQVFEHDLRMVASIETPNDRLP